MCHKIISRRPLWAKRVCIKREKILPTTTATTFQSWVNNSFAFIYIMCYCCCSWFRFQFDHFVIGAAVIALSSRLSLSLSLSLFFLLYFILYWYFCSIFRLFFFAIYSSGIRSICIFLRFVCNNVNAEITLKAIKSLSHCAE